MKNITKQQTPVDTGLVYSIGTAVNLAELDDAMREFARQPWNLGGNHQEEPAPQPFLIRSHLSSDEPD